MSSSAGLELAETFVAAAQDLNFRRTAERLHIDQSALTRRIQKFEAILGFPVFERTTREVSLTPPGQILFEGATSLLQDYANTVEAARLVASGKTGRLRIAYMAFAATELMPRAVSRFRDTNPEIDVTVRYIRTQGQRLALANDEIDVGYMIGPFEHSEFKSVTVANEPLHAVIPSNHPLQRNTSVTPGDLAGHRIVIGDQVEWEAYRRRLDELFSANGVTLNFEFEASNTLALMGFVSAGFGVTIYPESQLEFIGSMVQSRPIDHPEFTVETVLVRKRTNRTKPVLAFFDIATRSARNST